MKKPKENIKEIKLKWDGKKWKPKKKLKILKNN